MIDISASIGVPDFIVVMIVAVIKWMVMVNEMESKDRHRMNICGKWSEMWGGGTGENKYIDIMKEGKL